MARITRRAEELRQEILDLLVARTDLECSSEEVGYALMPGVAVECADAGLDENGDLVLYVSPAEVGLLLAIAPLLDVPSYSVGLREEYRAGGRLAKVCSDYNDALGAVLVAESEVEKERRGAVEGGRGQEASDERSGS